MRNKRLIFLIALISFFTVQQGFSLSITNATSYTKDYFTPLLEMFATTANSGLGAVSDTGKFLSFGAQVNMSINPEEDILAQAENKDNYKLPVLYANIRFGNLFVFARGLLWEQDDITFKYYGGGVGLQFFKKSKILPTIKILGAYQKMVADGAFFELTSITAAAIADYRLPIPVIKLHVFAVGGYERNSLKTTWDPAAIVGNPANLDFGLDQYRLSLGARFEMLDCWPFPMNTPSSRASTTTSPPASNCRQSRRQ